MWRLNLQVVPQQKPVVLSSDHEILENVIFPRVSREGLILIRGAFSFVISVFHYVLITAFVGKDAPSIWGHRGKLD